MAARKGSARWTGDLNNGSGQLIIGEAVWSGEYSFASRFQDGVGTNPEELIAAAHAGCFSMALTHVLTTAGHTPRSIQTVAHVHLRLLDGTPTIKQIDLETQGDVSGIDENRFRELAEKAKTTCAISRALAGVASISISATLTPQPVTAHQLNTHQRPQ
jgi:osmotically inducible protein OsmC